MGYERDFFDFGSTALSVDFHDGEDIASMGSNSDSRCVRVVQNIDHYTLGIFGGSRSYSAASTTESFQDVDTLLAGARYKFRPLGLHVGTLLMSALTWRASVVSQALGGPVAQLVRAERS